MRGSIIKRGKNSYTIILNLGIDPATGKRKQQWVTIKGNKKSAEKRLSELLSQHDSGTFIKPGKLTVGDYLEQWLKDCRVKVAPNTAETYAWFVGRHIKPVLGQIPLTALRPEHLQRLYTDKLTSGRRDGKGGLGSRSVRYIHTTLHKALKSAVKMGMIARNPADSVDTPKVTRHEMRVMSESDMHIFLEYAKTLTNGIPYYALFYTALFTGMRRSELLALKWYDIDLLGSEVSVNRTLHQLHNREIIIKQPKTAKGKRLIALTPTTVSVLREHREAQEKLRQSLGVTLSDDDLIFCQYDGKPLLPDSVTQAWHNLARHIGLKGISLNAARHTHASLMLKQGIHPKIVQERLGHASIQITLDTYSHVSPGLQEAAARKFDEVLNHKREKDALGKIG